MKNEKLNNCYEAAHNEWMKNGGVLVHGRPSFFMGNYVNIFVIFLKI